MLSGRDCEVFIAKKLARLLVQDNGLQVEEPVSTPFTFQNKIKSKG